MATFLIRDRPHLLERPQYGSPAVFCGRQEERAALTDWLCKRGADGRLPIFVLYDGPGGTGKSSLAYVWMKRDVVGDELPLPSDQPDEAKRSRVGSGWRTGLTVLWFSFYAEDGGGDFHSFLECAIEHLSHGTKRAEEYRDGKTLNYARLAEDVIECVTSAPTLLIWDGAERLLREFDANQRISKQDRGRETRLCADVNVQRFLVQLSASAYPRLLILSRIQFQDLIDTPRKELKLGGLAPQAAVHLLQQRSVRGLVSELEERAADYDFHPLALSNLAAAVTDDFSNEGDIRNAPRFDPGVPMRRRRRHVLDVAFKRRGDFARELLCRFSAVHGTLYLKLAHILVNGTEDRSNLAMTLSELSRHGLLTKDEKESAYRMHPIVREYAYAHLKNKSALHERLAKYYETKPLHPKRRDVSPVWLNAVKQFYRHTAKAHRYSDAYDIFRVEHTTKTKSGKLDLNDILFYVQGAYREYIELLRELFPSGIASPPAVEPNNQAFVLNDLALAYSCTGDPQCARFLLECGATLGLGIVRKARRDTLDWLSGKAAVATCFESLATVQMLLGNLALSEKYVYRSIRAYEDIRDAAERLQLRGESRLLHGNDEGLYDLALSKGAYLEYFTDIKFPYRVRAKLSLRTGDWHEIGSFYEKMRQSLEERGEGDIFYDILSAQGAIFNGDVVAADKAISFAEKAHKSVNAGMRFYRMGYEIKYLRGEISLLQSKPLAAEKWFQAAP